tara:strand:+ start:234 stop:446 length:213 start_codon:yes stop_codon:yes gene_type:complete
MKVYQLKEMSESDLKTRLNDCLEAIQNLKFQKALQQLEDGSSISKMRKEIAQIKTVLKEFDLGIRKKKGI